MRPQGAEIDGWPSVAGRFQGGVHSGLRGYRRRAKRCDSACASQEILERLLPDGRGAWRCRAVVCGVSRGSSVSERVATGRVWNDRFVRCELFGRECSHGREWLSGTSSWLDARCVLRADRRGALSRCRLSQSRYGPTWAAFRSAAASRCGSTRFAAAEHDALAGWTGTADGPAGSDPPAGCSRLLGDSRLFNAACTRWTSECA